MKMHTNVRARRASIVAAAVACAALARDAAAGAAVFVSTAGNDASSGRSPDEPLATLAQALRRAGTSATIYLRRGDRVREAVEMRGAQRRHVRAHLHVESLPVQAGRSCARRGASIPAPGVR